MAKIERGKNFKIYAIIITCFVLGGLATFLSILFTEKRSYTSENKDTGIIDVLSCSKEQSGGSFFVPKDAISYTHEVEVTFRNNEADKISYSYYGQYINEDIAESENARFNADYDIYMGNINVADRNVLSATFTSAKNATRISLFAKVKNLTAGISRFFFLDDSNYKKVGEYSKNTLNELYESKGFKCINN